MNANAQLKHVEKSSEVFEIFNVKEREDLVDMDDLKLAFGVSKMTIQTWRKSGLPYVSIPHGKKNVVLFRKNKVIEWSEWNGKEIKNSEILKSKLA